MKKTLLVLSMLYLSYSQGIVNKISCADPQTLSEKDGKCMYKCSDSSMVDSLSQCQQQQSSNSDTITSALMKSKMALMIVSCVFLFLGFIAMVWRFKRQRDFYSNITQIIQVSQKNLQDKENKYLLQQQQKKQEDEETPTTTPTDQNVKAQTNEIFITKPDKEGNLIRITKDDGIQITHNLEEHQTLQELISYITKKLQLERKGIKGGKYENFLIEVDNQEPILCIFRGHYQQ